MNIAVSLNSKYMQYTYVMLESLFINNTSEPEIVVFVLNNDLTSEDTSLLNSLAEKYSRIMNFIHIDRNTFPKDLPFNEAWSLETYFRLMLTDILPADIDRVLYLDVDMIVDKSLSNLYYTDFEGTNFIACHDMTVGERFNDYRDSFFEKFSNITDCYFNAGMMIWNIKKLREEGYSFSKYMELAKSFNYHLFAFDQDLLNYMHYGQVLYVDEILYDLFSKKAYNAGITYSDVKAATVITHFAGMKPWEGQYIHYEIEQLWWDYAKLSPFYTSLLEDFVKNSINDPLIYNTMDQISKENSTLKKELGNSLELLKRLTQK